MFENLKEKFPASLAKPDPRVFLAGITLFALIAAVIIVVYLWRDQGSYRALYGANEAYPVSDVIAALESEAISYQLHPQTGQILVKDSHVSRARMMLSAKGIKVAVPSGYELFDKEEPLGTSQFVQDVRLKRSLEGEIARTIMTIKGVERARVHLAIQENRSFIMSKKDPAKASITLQLSPGIQLRPEQISAIVDLVSNSVPNLSKDAISVVDQQGMLLSRGLNLTSNPVQNWQMVDDYQIKATNNAELVLAPVVGFGNFRISVTADIDFSQREETIQTYGDTPKVRNEVLRDESVLDQLALGVPGSLSNNPINQPEPDENGEANTDNKAATSLRNESNRQMDYDQNITHVKHAPFTLRQQSIAVVINAKAAPEEGWTPEARERLSTMIKTAVGFNEARGDQFTLSVFAFSDAEPLPDTMQFWEMPLFFDLVKMLLTGLLGLLLILFVLRPALKTLLEKNAPQLTEPVLDTNALNLPSTPLPSISSQMNQEDNLQGKVLGEFNPLSEIRLPAPGSGIELQIEHLKMLADNDPERVSEVIKQWINRNDRNPS